MVNKGDRAKGRLYNIIVQVTGGREIVNVIPFKEILTDLVEPSFGRKYSDVPVKTSATSSGHL
jgi:hypothetical protein